MRNKNPQRAWSIFSGVITVLVSLFEALKKGHSASHSASNGADTESSFED